MLPKRVNKLNRCSFLISLDVATSLNRTVTRYLKSRVPFAIFQGRGVSLNGTVRHELMLCNISLKSICLVVKCV